MKRDNDYLRNLLIEIEEKEDWLILVPKTLGENIETRKRNYHIDLLCDAGLMMQVSTSGFRMTSQGHDYLSAIRSDGIWQQTKNAVTETGGGAVLEMVKSVALAFTKKKIEQHTGLEL